LEVKMAFTGKSPRVRPSIEILGSSNAGSAGGVGMDEEVMRAEDETETVSTNQFGDCGA